ncbi:MAG: hypothetical protein RIQ72_649 [Candidatus Parcubacteria bacterium]|jgi:prepilin-type N-terminal cleavage/methylation domain-containing protein
MKKVNKYKKAFTIIEVIIAMALLGALSVYVFAVAEPLRTKTEQVQSRLMQYAEAQYLTLYLSQLISIFDTPDIFPKQDLELYINNKSLSPGTFFNLDTIVEGQNYVLFSKDSTKVLCGFFNPLKSDIPPIALSDQMHGTLEFRCHFVYQDKRRTYVFLDSYAPPASSTSVAIQIQGIYTQIKIKINEYDLTAGFLPSVKQVIQ